MELRKKLKSKKSTVNEKKKLLLLFVDVLPLRVCESKECNARGMQLVNGRADFNRAIFENGLQYSVWRRSFDLKEREREKGQKKRQ